MNLQEKKKKKINQFYFSFSFNFANIKKVSNEQDILQRATSQRPEHNHTDVVQAI